MSDIVKSVCKNAICEMLGINSAKRMFSSRSKKPVSAVRAAIPAIEPIKSYTCSVVGTFADCACPAGATREGQIRKMKPNETLYLEEFEYEGKPAFYVCRTKNRVDIGCIPATTAARLVDKYADCEYKVVILEKKNDHHNNATFHIRIDVYKK